MSSQDRVRLKHMLDAAEKIAEFTADHKQNELLVDEVLLLAVIRLIEVIGEAAKAVSEETRALAPEIP